MIAAQEPDLQLDRSSRLLFHLLTSIMEQRGAGGGVGTAGGPGTANNRQTDRRTTDRLIDHKKTEGASISGRGSQTAHIPNVISVEGRMWAKAAGRSVRDQNPAGPGLHRKWTMFLCDSP